MSRIFSQVKNLSPLRSVFDLSYEQKLTCDMGELIPIMCDEVVPGDTFQIGNEIVVRFQPLVAPLMHEINAFVHYFFVPYRLLWADWETFITGGVSGDEEPALPKWVPTEYGVSSLWDYLGFPAGVLPDGRYPMIFPLRAYNLVYNEYYRDENLIDEVDLDQEIVLNRAWEKDYFTSALLEQQRGTAPALPVSGSTSAVWDAAQMNNASATNTVGVSDTGSFQVSNTKKNQLKVALDKNVVDLSSATTFDVADLRLAFSIQKWMERNNRAGARYTEFLKGHFGVSPRDERLQRPEYIGGTKSPIIISEVLQTSSTDLTSPQGNLAGHGLTADRQFAGKYHATEYGCIIGILSVMPRPNYQQGIDRQWLRQTKYDFYFPEFANLSEQAIERVEIAACPTEADNIELFGYQGRYDEMRVKRSQVHGLMRSDLDFWHLGREFADPTVVELNETFITCIPRKDIFAVPSEPGLIINFGNKIRAVRPLPIQSNPGLIDHDGG